MSKNFCEKCGLFTDSDTCPDCNLPTKEDRIYFIPAFSPADETILFISLPEALKLFASGKAEPIPDSTDTFNVKINGEWNGIEIGKKIKEKNEQLKRKVSGYSYEERSIRKEVAQQLEDKRKKELSQ